MFHVRQIQKKTAGSLGALTILATAFILSGTAAQAAGKKGAKAQKPWIKLCRTLKGKEGVKKVCSIRADLLDGPAFKVYAPVAIEQVAGKPDQLMVNLPHIWPIVVKATNKKTKKQVKMIRTVDARWAVQEGVSIKIGTKGKGMKMKFAFCDTFGCVAQMKASKSIIASLKKADKVIIAGYSLSGSSPLGTPITLNGFGKAFSGDPLDEKIYNNAWKKRLTAIRRKQIIAAKRRQAARLAAKKKK